ncbi:MAG: TraM recognition domain-containing protein, partial [Solirubrobacterales bacterium]|nr:TraM recognition domain-containing protein [Solirubrobacterales bacterium]
PDGPSHWNPLAHGNPTELKDKLIATERFTEPHYQRAAERYIQTALQVLRAAHPSRPPQLEELVGAMEPRRLSGLLRHLRRPAAERVQDYLASLTPDQHSAIRGLGTRLALVSESHTRRYLSDAGAGDGGAAGRGAIDLRAALAGEQVVLFSLNAGTYGQLSAQLGTLAIQDLVSAVGERLRAGERSPDGAGAGIEAGRGAGDGGRRPPAIIAIDEFSALGSDNVIALLARAREAGVSVLLCTQELADLDRAAPGLRDQVLGNTAIKLAHRQDVPSSAQTIAQMAGTEKAWEETRQLGGRLLAGHETGRGTRRQVEQFIVHPNEIKTLPPGEAVLISKLPPARARTVRVSAPQLDRPREPARRGDELAR